MKKGNDQYMPYLFIAGVVAIVAVVALVLSSSGSLEGAPVYEIKTGEYQQSCTDDDPENDYFKLGKTRFGAIEYLDYCLGDSVIQYHCASSQTARTTAPYECPNGCLKGFCLRE